MHHSQFTIIFLLGLLTFVSAYKVAECQRLIAEDLAHSPQGLIRVSTHATLIVRSQKDKVALWAQAFEDEMMVINPHSMDVMRMLQNLADLGLEGRGAELQGVLWTFSPCKFYP